MYDHKSIDFCITTFLRYDCLRVLLASIKNSGYKNRIIVADQNREIDWSVYNLYPDVEVLELPYDVGLSEARNHLIQAVTAPFMLLLEDDFEFTSQTKIEKMAHLMGVEPNIGVVGGQVRQLDIPIHFEWIPEVKDGILYHKPDGDHFNMWNDIKYKKTGAVLNFALMRREMLRTYYWDPRLKLREHADFYLRLAASEWQVLYTPDVIINDAKPSRYPEEYKKLKSRDEFMVMMMEKNNLRAIYYQNGTIKELVNGKIQVSRGAPLST